MRNVVNQRSLPSQSHVPRITGFMLALCVALLTNSALPSRAHASPTGLATYPTGSVYTWRIRDHTGKVLREFQSVFADASNTDAEAFSWRQDYLYAGAQVIGIEGDNDSWQRSSIRYALDQQGTPRALIDASGALRSAPIYEPYGEEITDWRDQSALKYTGQERDFPLLDYFHARYFSASLGRYISPDPARSGWNLYAYASDDPIGSSDPTGLADTKEKPMTMAQAASLKGVQAGAAAYYQLVFGEYPSYSEAKKYTWKDELLLMFDFGMKNASENISTSDGGISEEDVSWYQLREVFQTPQEAPNGPALPNGYSLRGPPLMNPPNNGALPGTTEEVVLPKGTIVQRQGGTTGYFVAPAGSNSKELSLRPGSEDMEMNFYVLEEPITVSKSIIAPAYGYKGLGTQYVMPNPIETMLKLKLISIADFAPYVKH